MFLDGSISLYKGQFAVISASFLCACWSVGVNAVVTSCSVGTVIVNYRTSVVLCDISIAFMEQRNCIFVHFQSAFTPCPLGGNIHVLQRNNK
jgi:hypothetical protein